MRPLNIQESNVLTQEQDATTHIANGGLHGDEQHEVTQDSVHSVGKTKSMSSVSTEGDVDKSSRCLHTDLDDSNEEAKFPIDNIENTVTCLAGIDKAIHDWHSYVNDQKETGHPLYKWPRCDHYETIRRRVQGLDESLAAMENYSSLPEQFSTLLSEARHYSTSTSRAIADALSVVSNKTETYVIELDSSVLSETEKAKANAHITSEVQQVLEHCSLVTERVWTAIDHLQALKQKKLTKEKSGQIWWSLVASLVFLAVSSAMAGICFANAFNSGVQNIALGSSENLTQYARILEVTSQTQAITDLTSQIYDLKLHDMQRRYDSIAVLSQANGLRLDNIVDSLGPPNEHGVYYEVSSNTEDAEAPAGEDRGTVEEVRRLQKELVTMRRNIDRMDIRLTSEMRRLHRKQT